MKNLIKKNWLRIVSPVIVIAIFLVLFGYSNESSNKNNRIERPYLSSPISTKGDITCSYPQVMTGSYNEDKIAYEIGKPEKNPIIFTFSDIGENSAKLKYIDATQTISESPIVKLSEDTERIVFIQADRYYVALHTIFKGTGVSIFSKQASLLGIPLGNVAFGTCIDS